MNETTQARDTLRHDLQHDRVPDAAAETGERDVVCGMRVRPDSPHHAEYHGRTYRFCSAGCRAKFVADPERWLAPKSATAKEAADV